MLVAEGPLALFGLGSRKTRSYLHTWRAIRALRAGAAANLRDLVAIMVPEEGPYPYLVWAMQHRVEVLPFLELLAHRRPERVLEIGTASGGLLFLLARVAAPTAHLISVDLPGGSFGGGYHYWRAPLYRSFAQPGQRVSLIRGNSHCLETWSRVHALLDGEQLDLLFIDGDHTLEGVQADFCLYRPLVAPGGLIALHDIVPASRQPEVQVHTFWGKLRPTYDTSEFIASPSQEACGIGLIHLPPR